MNRFLIEIKNADVYLRSAKILSAIHWTMRENENWAIVGNNGSGKTTLMRLVFGELIPVYGGEVHWFSNREQTPIWDIRRKIGYVSAEYQADYDHNITGLEVVESGFFSSIGLYHPVTPKQKETALEWMDFLGIAYLASKRYRRMSYGEARRTLLARALVNHPALLILDEACNGLDIPTKEVFLDAVEKLSHIKTRLIYITHHIEEITPSITHVLYMKDGGVFLQGKKQDMLKDKILSEALNCRIALKKNSGRYWIASCTKNQKEPAKRRRKTS